MPALMEMGGAKDAKKKRSSSPPLLTPPTRGGEYSLPPCIPPPVPLTEGGERGRGRFRWG